ncbi:DUF7822 domain-containing protein [Breznakiellaceae bacterium SP9]
MANRSYIYSIDFDRTIEERDENKNVCGLSEYAYMIPLSYKIMVSQNAKMSKSILWDTDELIAIIADFQLGRQKLFDFLNSLLKIDLFEKNNLEEQIQRTKGFLYDKKHENKFIILECGELFEMENDEEGLEKYNKKLFEEIMDIEKTIEKTIFELYEMKNKINEKNIETQMWNILGIDNWNETLYYE